MYCVTDASQQKKRPILNLYEKPGSERTLYGCVPFASLVYTVLGRTFLLLNIVEVHTRLVFGGHEPIT